MLCVFVYAAADTVRLASPDGRTNVAVWYENGLKYSVLHNGIPLLVASEIDMTVLDGGVRKRIGRIRAVSRRKVDERISVPIPEKRRIIANECNELEICCRNSYMIRFRAYDDGVAYRIETGFRDSVLVVGETARFNFPAMSRTYFPRITCRPMPISFIRHLRRIIRVSGSIHWGRTHSVICLFWSFPNGVQGLPLWNRTSRVIRVCF